MLAILVAVIIPWMPGSHQAPLSHAGFDHGGPEVCWRWGNRGPWECALLRRSRRQIRRHYP